MKSKPDIALRQDTIESSVMFQSGNKLKELRKYTSVLPGIALMAIFAIYPVIFLLKVSFQMYNPINASNPFVGFSNYSRVLNDPNFWDALKITFLFVVVVVLIELTLGLGLAVLLNQKLKGLGLFRTLFFLPIVMAPTVVGLMFRFMTNDEYGVLNYFLSSLGLHRIAFLSSMQYALPTLMVTDIWQWTPFMMIILLAGLQGVPQDALEAAQMDGSSSWRTFWTIVLPMIRKTMMIAILLRVVDSFRIYDTVYMMTQGGPINATTTLSFLIYNDGFKNLDFGDGAATAILMLIIVVIFITVFLKRVNVFGNEAQG